MINNPLQDEKSAALTGNPIKILNPLSNDLACLRTSLIPGALQTVVRNLNSGEKDLFLFEIGNAFNKISSGQSKVFRFYRRRKTYFRNFRKIKREGMAFGGKAGRLLSFKRCRRFLSYKNVA
jgi:phenylalanyl-tRNA synthetase beta subunit